MKFRTFDGMDGSWSHPGANAAGSAFARLGDARFADGVSVPVDGPNPREVSNVVVGEGEAGIPNPEGVSGMMYAWGQFIDHDLTRTLSDGRTHVDIRVPWDDPDLPRGSTISMTRARTDPDSGTGPGNGGRCGHGLGSRIHGLRFGRCDRRRCCACPMDA
jgi:hypothetical protein